MINTKRSFKCRYYEYSFNAKDVFANLKGGAGAGGAGAGLNTLSGPYAIEMSPVTLFHVLPALRSAKRARAEQSEATWEVKPEVKRPTLTDLQLRGQLRQRCAAAAEHVGGRGEAVEC